MIGWAFIPHVVWHCRPFDDNDVGVGDNRDGRVLYYIAAFNRAFRVRTKADDAMHGPCYIATRPALIAPSWRDHGHLDFTQSESF